MQNKPSFELVYARKRQKRFKNLKNATYHVISSTLLFFFIITIWTQLDIYNTIACQVSHKTNQVWTTISEKMPKTL